MGGDDGEAEGLRYAVRSIMFEDGERLPILVYIPTGIPVFSAMNYVLGKLRAEGQAANSIEQCCRVLALAHHWLDHAGIDLLARCMEGKVLEDSEIDALENLLRLGSKEFVAEVTIRYAKGANHGPSLVDSAKRLIVGLDERAAARDCDPCPVMKAKLPNQKVVSLEQFRRRPLARKARKEVSSQTHAIRLHHAQAYLKQIAFEYSVRAGTTAANREAIRVEAKRMADKFKALSPGIFLSAEQAAAEGLAQSHVDLLVQSINPDASNEANPWVDPFVRKRNQLMILTLLATGMRGGELLKMKTTDIHRGKASLSIKRTPNDAEDTRARQPQAKTRARDLALDNDLYAALNDFVLNERKSIPAKQRKHPFIWTTEAGAPLSINALSKMFVVLREKVPELPKSLTGHALRYTATDDLFGRLSESSSTDEQAGEQLRYVMGWSPTSNMPARYARRKIRDQANNVLLGMQKSLINKQDKNKGGAK